MELLTKHKDGRSFKSVIIDGELYRVRSVCQFDNTEEIILDRALSNTELPPIEPMRISCDWLLENYDDVVELLESDRLERD
jgi:hypothetical protein